MPTFCLGLDLVFLWVVGEFLVGVRGSLKKYWPFYNREKFLHSSFYYLLSIISMESEGSLNV